MNNQKKTEWIVLKGIPTNMYIEKIEDNLDLLTISLISENLKLKLVFEEYYSYRVTNESYRLKTLNSNCSLCTSHTAYFSSDSPYLRWIKSESYDIVSTNLVHYFIGIDEIIEVLSTHPPVIVSI